MTEISPSPKTLRTTTAPTEGEGGTTPSASSWSGTKPGGAGKLPKTLMRWAPIALVAVALLLGYGFDLHRYLSIDGLRQSKTLLSAQVEQNALLAALAYVAVYVAAVALSFPGASFLTAAGGFMFGTVLGTALALFAATTGAVLIFLIAKTSIGTALAERAGPRMQRLREGFAEESFSYLLFLRLVPVFPFWMVNLAAALFGVRLAPYIAATAIGIVPGTFVLAYFGHGLETAFDAKGPPWSAGLFLSLALLGVLALVPVLVRKIRGRKRQASAPAPHIRSPGHQ